MALRALLLLCGASAVAADMRSPVTVHVLDTTKGHPAAGIQVSLARQDGAGAWVHVGNSTTDVGGRADMLPLAPFNATPTDVNCCFVSERLAAGKYALVYDLSQYYPGEDSFFPELRVHFNVFADKVAQYYHVPVLLNNAGFTAYRGS
eukprot:TRINITY_DN2424_c0_g1_i1.p2 TRINITY_DN2424_c0_g1~~TRINITY_DN2424_c0_g1_i1.p2  ORF type:complete len:168 (+),score=54.89 TRINITY_DN2424_c0_g1_i1:63-506(+)